MNAAQFEALRETADDGGVDFDGLRVAATADGYRFAVPGAVRDELTEAGLREAARDNATYVEDWHFWTRVAPESDDRRAFLRWIERADERSPPERREALAGGTTREWGELAVTGTVDDAGRRRYELRHADDADTRVNDLETRTDPLTAREIARTDDRGRYRPLSTAPSLPAGWAIVDLSPAAAVRAVDGFYPATVANWAREQRGDLDVTHWRETMDRQTGIYGLVKTWDRGEGHDHVEWVAEACCVDSQCLKRREWEYDEETELDVDGGDGHFPCREPCSLVVAAARRWTRLDAEETRTYEFELTPGEKEQVEAIVDAVADGRTGAIREADFSEAANRYRARFLRAKRFDDEGHLSGTPTADAGGNGTDEADETGSAGEPE